MRRVYFTWADFDIAVSRVIEGLLELRVPLLRVFGISRGGLVLAVVLSHRLGIPLVTLEDAVTLGSTLVVNDISDSGRALRRFGPFGVATATIHIVPGTAFVPDVWAFERPRNCWVVYPWEVKDEQAKS